MTKKNTGKAATERWQCADIKIGRMIRVDFDQAITIQRLEIALKPKI